MDKEKLKEILVEMPNLCGGGQLYAIVFCCGTQKPCPIRDEALRMLGISKDEYTILKEKYAVRHDKVCFRNLAYCCSLLKECPIRNMAMKELEITPEKYIEYKASLLMEFMKIARNKDSNIWEKRVLKPLLFLVLDPEEEVEWKGIAIGNLDISQGLFFIRRITGRRKVNIKALQKGQGG